MVRLPRDLAGYEQAVAQTRDRRMKWWREGRFGMFVHWGPYSGLGRGEWVRNMERIPEAEYAQVAAAWKTQPNAAREWCKLARKAGMKYVVMTTKHHDGFCLWDSKLTEFNAARMGPKRDLVKEFVEACRAEGLKVGLYYSLMDWHHPDGATGEHDAGARARFQAYTHGLVRELCANYGKIDILWYDVSVPLWGWGAGGWDSIAMNAAARELQPGIIINNRAVLAEDFSTPERMISAAEAGRDWESCMTTTSSWAWSRIGADGWISAREVLEMLRRVTAGGGNLLLNVGPAGDGKLPKEAGELLGRVGKWLKKYGDVMYGKVDRVREMETCSVGDWTARGNTRFLWMRQSPGDSVGVGGLSRKPVAVRLLPSGRKLAFEWTEETGRVVVRGLGKGSVDADLGYGILAFEFAGPVIQHLGPLMMPKRPLAEFVARLRHGGYWPRWKLSRRMELPAQGVAGVEAARLADGHDWRAIWASGEGITHPHEQIGEGAGVCYLAEKMRAKCGGAWRLWVGHDGAVRVFIDGREVFCGLEPGTYRGDRGFCDVELTEGEHELCVAMDLSNGRRLSCCWELPAGRKMVPLEMFPAVN